MTEPLIIALDQGTSGCRAAAVDRRGRVHTLQCKEIFPRRPSVGLSEYTAEELWQTQREVLHAVLAEVGPQRVASLAVCSQRSTIVLWDKTTGQPVAPVLTWEDGRAQQQSDRVSLSQAEIHAQTGLFKTPYFSAPKIAWCLENFPEARAAAQAGKLLAAPVASFFIWKLTAGAVFAADATLSQRTLLWDIHAKDWSETLCRHFGIPPACLPALFPTAADYGSFVYKGVSIPISVCVADQQAALAYHQLLPGETAINYGTGAFVLHHTGEKAAVLPGMLSSVAAGAEAGKTQFLLEGPVFSAGSVLQWLQAQGILPSGIDIDAMCRVSNNPVLFLPAFGGLGAPYWNYRVSAVIEGLSARTRSADFVTGALQGIAHLVADIADYLHKNGYSLGKVQVSGGLAQSTYLLQSQADLLQTPLSVCPQAQSTILGAALLAARAQGWNTDGWSPACKTVFPHRSSEEIKILRTQWKQLVDRAAVK